MSDLSTGPEGRRWSLLYDVSRLCTRVLNPTPNGIDRLDALLCRGLLDAPGADAASLVFGWPGPRLLPAGEGLSALERAERMWGENDGFHAGHDALPAITAWLTGRGAVPSQRVVAARRGRFAAAVDAFRRLGVRRGGNPIREAPKGAIYFNATHFPLDWPSHVAWLQTRRDVQPVILVHDLLALDYPEFFWAGEPERHRARLALLARRGAGAIVTTHAVAIRLKEKLEQAGRRDLPILALQPPVSAMFHVPGRLDTAIAAIDYFVACGTIEPRKNHRLLLRIWRRAVADQGTRAPKLIVVGKRGWLSDDVIAELGDLALAGHVLEVTSLTSGDYKILLENACALLAPSFAEGFGLPMAEALAVGTPVIAADIPPFREQTGGVVTFLDPQDDDAWYVAIEAYRGAPRVPRSGTTAVTREAYLRRVSDFLRTLA